VKEPGLENVTVALAGRRVDPVGTDPGGFPIGNVNRVSEELRAVFETLRPATLISSAACGSDLLALEEAGRLGIRRRVILPFDPEQFLRTSVEDRPGDWASLYKRIIKEVCSSGDLVDLKFSVGQDDDYRLTNLAILDEALEVARASAGKVIAVLVWDGQSRGPGDLTENFRVEAQKKGFPIVEVPTIPGA
jgi:hypothetical protein